MPDDELPTVFALAEQASPLPLHKVDNTSSSFTPWGYKAVQKECTSGTSSSSWQEVRAGLLSPPPLAAALLSSPVRPFADSGDEARQPDEDEENEASDRHDEQSTTGTGARRLVGQSRRLPTTCSARAEWRSLALLHDCSSARNCSCLPLQ